MAAASRTRDAAAANLGDDSHVIVVVDSRTGEIRQCGNYSGHCIGMNPWAGPLGQGQAAPVPLTKHAADLAREAEQQGRPVAEAAEAVAVEANAAEAAPARR
jgi:hypothetical protein